MRTLIIAVLASTALCTGCSPQETKTDEPASSYVEKAKFKGSKLAPSQDVMNRAATMAFWKSAGVAIVTPGAACKNYFRGRPIPQDCQADIDGVISKSTFVPRECRKGDERKGYDSVLVNPVSCDGEIDTPHATAKVLMIFHETSGELEAWSGGMVANTLVKH